MRLTKNKILICLGFALILNISGFKSNNNQQPQEVKPESIENQEDVIPEEIIRNDVVNEETAIEYDELQQLYIDIDKTMTYDEVLKMVTDSGLCYAEHTWNGSKDIKVAFAEGVTSAKYADSGDYILVNFKEIRSNEGKDYIFGYLEYFNEKKFITIFEYIDGVYWDFREASDGQGYYINDYIYKRDDGYEIKYSNGNTKKTRYIKVESKDEQLEYIYNYVK